MAPSREREREREIFVGLFLHTIYPFLHSSIYLDIFSSSVHCFLFFASIFRPWMQQSSQQESHSNFKKCRKKPVCCSIQTVCFLNLDHKKIYSGQFQFTKWKISVHIDTQFLHLLSWPSCQSYTNTLTSRSSNKTLIFGFPFEILINSNLKLFVAWISGVLSSQNFSRPD